MKKVFLALLPISIALLSCTKNSKEEAPISSRDEDQSIQINAKVVSIKPFRLQSIQLKEVSATIRGTEKATTGYILNGVEMPPADVQRGYFLVGDCYRYGSLICAGDCIFIECPVGQCIGFDPICPEPGGGIARKAPGSEVLLKFPKK